MKALIKVSVKLITVGLLIWGGVTLYKVNDQLGKEQHTSAFKQCEKNNFKGWVKLQGDFTVYRCNAETKTIEII